MVDEELELNDLDDIFSSEVIEDDEEEKEDEFSDDDDDIEMDKYDDEDYF